MIGRWLKWMVIGVICLQMPYLLAAETGADPATAAPAKDEKASPEVTPAAPGPSAESIASAPKVRLEDTEEALGIRVVALRRTAGGQMLDFRYRVVNPEKAEAVVKDKTPHLVDPSGHALPVPVPPKVGPLRTSTKTPVKDCVYFIIFANPQGRVKSEDKVDVAVGGIRIEGVSVQ